MKISPTNPVKLDEFFFLVASVRDGGDYLASREIWPQACALAVYSSLGQKNFVHGLNLGWEIKRRHNRGHVFLFINDGLEYESLAMQLK